MPHLPDFDLAHAEFDDSHFEASEKERQKKFKSMWNYYDGKHKKHLKVKQSDGSIDDNVKVNFCAILVDRTVSRLFGDPQRGDILKLDVEPRSEAEMAEISLMEGIVDEEENPFQEEELEGQKYLQSVWERSGGLDSILFRMGVFGAVTGHYAAKLRKEEDGPRVVVLDPSLLSFLTQEDDKDRIRAYKIEFNKTVRDPDSRKIVKDASFRQLILHGPDFGGDPGWYVADFIDFKRSGDTSDRWKIQSDEIEVWEFPPIIEGQNLPHARSHWGKSDMENVTELNDEVNFILSNVNRIVRFHAHPRTVGIGVEPDNISETAVEAFWAIPGNPDEVEIFNLEMQSELRATFDFFQLIREAFWTISREADPSVFKDKIGNVTNFGLRVLYLDALNKVGEKRQTYGSSLEKLANRLFELNDMSELTIIPRWPDPLPSDPRETVETMMMELDAGILSRETAAIERGRNWAQEIRRMKSDEKRRSMGRKLLAELRGEGEGEIVRPNVDRRNLDDNEEE